MKKAIIAALSLALVLTMLIAPAYAAGKATVTKEAFYVRPYFDSHAGEIYVEITNTGDKPIIFNGGLIELYNPEGDAIESSSLYYCYPSVLAAGEVGYVFRTIPVDEATEKSYIDDYSLTITGKAENSTETVRLPSSGVYEEYQQYSWSTTYAVTTFITNNTDEMVWDLVVVAAVYDADDNLLYADYTTPYTLGLPPTQTAAIRIEIDSRIREAWVEEGVEPARIETIAFIEKDVE